jgi:hypothetical protein
LDEETLDDRGFKIVVVAKVRERCEEIRGRERERGKIEWIKIFVKVNAMINQSGIW